MLFAGGAMKRETAFVPSIAKSSGASDAWSSRNTTDAPASLGKPARQPVVVDVPEGRAATVAESNREGIFCITLRLKVQAQSHHDDNRHHPDKIIIFSNLVDVHG
jgi:hypothetical protein